MKFFEGLVRFAHRHTWACRVTSLVLTAAILVLGILWIRNPEGPYEPIISVLAVLAALIGAPTLLGSLDGESNSAARIGIKQDASRTYYHNLRGPAYFAGREHEIAILRQYLSRGDPTPAVVITGIGGVGKTALASAIAHEYRRRYTEMSLDQRFEAIIWVSAKEEVLGVTGREPAAPRGLIFRALGDVYSTIALTLEREDITRAAVAEQDRLVQQALGRQRTLLVVDNLDTVTDNRVIPFLRNLPESTKVIVTSRSWVDIGPELPLKSLTPEAAQKLIAKLMADETTNRDVVLDATQQRQLLEATANLPLPIVLSVGRLGGGKENVDQVLAWLRDATGELPEYCVKGQVDLVQQRFPNAWHLLLACSLFNQTAGASREALGYVCDLTPEDRDTALTWLQRLSLLNRNQDDRFSMLPLVHGYSRAELYEVDFKETFVCRWLDWLLDFARSHGVEDEHVEEIQECGIEYSNVRYAIQWCYENGQYQPLLELVEPTWFYPYVNNLLSEVQEILDAAVKAAQRIGDDRAEGRLERRLARLAWVYYWNNESIPAHLERAEALARRYDDKEELAKIWDIRSDIWSRQGRLRCAEQLAQEMLEVGEQLNNFRLQASAAYRLAQFAAKREHFDEALQWLRKGEEWSRPHDYVRGLGWNLHRQGEFLFRQVKTDEAKTKLEQSLEMGNSWGDRRLIAFNKQRLAEVYSAKGQLQLARETALEALDVYGVPRRQDHFSGKLS